MDAKPGVEAEPDGDVRIDQTKAVEFLYSSNLDTQAIGLCGSLQFGNCYGFYPVGFIGGKHIHVTQEKLVDVAVGILLDSRPQTMERLENEWFSKEDAWIVLCTFIDSKSGIDYLFKAISESMGAEGITPLNSCDLMSLCSEATFSGVESKHLVDVSEAVLSYARHYLGNAAKESNADHLLNLCYTVVSAERENGDALHTVDFLLSIALDDQTKHKALNIIDSMLDRGMDVSGAEETLRASAKGKRDFVLNFARGVLAKAERLNFNKAGIKRRSYALVTGPVNGKRAAKPVAPQDLKGKGPIVRIT